MKNHFNWVAIVVACLTSSAMAADQSEGNSEILISGPLEHVDAARDTVTVFGREFTTDRASELSPGETVNVYGSLQPDGSISDAQIEPTTLFGSGADPVYLKGLVTDANAALGQIKIGDTTVDYTQQLASGQFTAPTVGQVIAVQGTQPLVKGVLLASDVGSNVISRFSVPGRPLSVSRSQAGGLTSLATQGSGVKGSATQGSGIKGFATQGSGIGSLATQGSGIGSLATQGSGIGSLATQGSGIGSLATQGSGIGSLATQGSGIGSLATQGSGVASLATQGSGIVALATQGSGSSR